MMLRGIEVEGFRSLRHAQIAGIKTVSSIVGRNNAGKTALFESLLLLAALRAGDTRLEALQQVLPWNRTLSDVVNDSITDRVRPGEIHLTLEFTPTAEEFGEILGAKVSGVEQGVLQGVSIGYELTLKSGAPKWPDDVFVPTSVVVRQGNKDYALLKLADLRNADAAYQVPVEGSLRNAIAAREPRALEYTNYGPSVDILTRQGLEGQGQPAVNLLMSWVSGLRFVGHTRQSHDRVDLTTPHLLKSDGSNLPRYFQHLLNNEPRKWDQLKAVFRQLVPWLRDVYSPISQAETSIRIAVDNEQDAANAFELANMGAGTTHLMAIIAMVWSAPEGSLCLVDEPEQGLHSSAQRDLALWLEWHAKEQGKQVLLATHSTIFANPSADRPVFLATYTPAEGTIFRQIEGSTTTQITAELGVRFADFFAYDDILVVDGETEFTALPLIAAALGLDFGALSIMLLPLHGDGRGRLTRLEDYLRFVHGTQVTPHVILDADSGVRTALNTLIAANFLAEEDTWLWSRGGHPGEFEDNVSDQQLVEAANAIAKASGVQAPSIRVEELAALRTAKPRTATSKLLRELYFGHYHYGLPKVDLARQIAAMISTEIGNGNRDFQVVTALEELRDSVTARAQP